MKKVFTMFMVAGFLSATAFIQAADAVDLKLNLKKGDVYRMRQTQEQTVSQTAFGQTQDNSQTMIYDQKIEVVDVLADGNMKIKASTESIKVKLTNPQETVEFDSTNPTDQENPEFAGYKAIANSEFLMTLDPKGNVVNVEGIEAMMDSVMKEYENLPAEAKGGLEESFKKMFSDENMKQMLGNVGAIYPDKSVSIGDTWSDEVSLDVAVMSMDLKNTYTLKEQKDGRAIIAVDSTISTKEPQVFNMGAMQMKHTINSGTQSGTVEVDETSGWIMRSQIDQNMTGTIEMTITDPSVPPEEQTQSWPFTMTSKITVETY